MIVILQANSASCVDAHDKELNIQILPNTAVVRQEYPVPNK